MSRYTQFTVVDECGLPICKTHQDDSETPIIEGSLVDLIEELAGIEDMGSDDLLDMLDRKTGVITMDTGTVYAIRRLEVEEHELNAENIAALSALAEQANG